MINLFLNRILRAIKIDISVFEEVEKERLQLFSWNSCNLIKFGSWCWRFTIRCASNFLFAPIYLYLAGTFGLILFIL